MKQNKPELVCPAGDWASLSAAVENEADSVYFGIKSINMRHFAPNFDILEIKKVMSFLREHNKKGYLTLNTIIMNSELKKVEKILREAKAADVDAVILWDWAVFSLAKKLGLRVHLSTQASVSNSEALVAYAKMGVKRVVLARECSLDDIKEITRFVKENKIGCEIETFIHGAMCVSISGRCFLSSYSFGKSANKGQCLQPCRREYYIHDREHEADYIVGEDYLLSPKDLCTVDFLDDLIKAGIHSFKIEGRMRSPEYLKVVTSVYRRGIDAYFESKLTGALKKRMQKELKTVYNRGFSTGFYFGRAKAAESHGLEHKYEKVFIGEVTRFFKKISVAEIRIRTKGLRRGDRMVVIGKNTPAEMATVQEIQLNNAFVDAAKKGDIVGVKLPFVVKPKDKIFLWQEKGRL